MKQWKNTKNHKYGVKSRSRPNYNKYKPPGQRSGKYKFYKTQWKRSKKRSFKPKTTNKRWRGRN